MNTPNIPTDSLYKFMAVAGLVSMILAVVMIIATSEDQDNKLEDLLSKEAIIKEEGKQLEKELKRIEHASKILAAKYNIDTVLHIIDSGYVFSRTIKGDKISVEVGNKIDSLLNSYTAKHQEFDLKRVELNSNIRSYNSMSARNEEYSFLYKVLLYGGEIFMIIGFFAWYDRIQKPLNIFRINKLLKEDRWYERCQSCYRSLRTHDYRGTDSSNDICKHYCKDCFDKGEFTEPELEFKEAKQRLLDKLNELGYNSVTKTIYLRQFNKLLRWVDRKKW